jgi:nitrogen regulatory protein PII
MIIIKYENEEEVKEIVDEQTKKGLIVVEVSNVGEGNFLGFDDRNLIPKEKTPIEVQLNDIKNNTDMIILKQEGLL